MLEEGEALKAIEIKSGETINPDFFKGLEFFKRISDIPYDNRFLVYDGLRNYKRSAGRALSWNSYTDKILYKND